MSKALNRLEILSRYDKDFRIVVHSKIKERLSRRRYGHVFSEAAHYLNRAAQYRKEGELGKAKQYVLGARSILMKGTSWGNIENQPRIKLP